MSRPSRRETYDDGQYEYDDRYDAGEFETYGQSTSHSRGPSSGEYYYSQAHYDKAPYITSSPAARRTPCDTHGYAREGSYAGEESLHRRLGRQPYGHTDRSTYNKTDPRTRVGRYSRSEHGHGRRSGLFQQISTDDCEVSREARDEGLHRRREQLRQHRRETWTSTLTADDYADGNPYVRSGRSGRRSAVTSENDPYLADVQAAHDDRPSSVRGLRQGYHPAYEYR
ncbi:hypothetical protein ST47_g9846 [Ascochyta rabiei]|uniref:Uncharacterized protein n=1 Tax=Didymella rabiei TaxID=5454 RepID=A0A162WFA6_DIDRA|nr:hypothetical protein ST47_g9846 [Ascochyta rabiei]